MNRSLDFTNVAGGELRITRGSYARIRDYSLHALYRTVLVIVYVAILAPMVIIIISSFSDSLYLAFPPQGFSTMSYQRFWSNHALRNALNVSASVGVTTTILSLLLAAPAAYAIDRFEFKGRRLIEMMLMAPLTLPVLMLAIAIVIFTSTAQIPRSFWMLVASHVLVTIPFVLRVLLTALAGFDRTLEEASASLGAKPIETLRRVTIRILQPGILSAAILAFVISFGQITMSIFIGGEGLTTLPVEIFLITDFGYDVAITAVSVIVMLVGLIMLAIIEFITGLERVV